MDKEKVHLDFPCRRCKMTFSTKREHLLHRKNVHENDPERKKHVCNACNKQFANERTLEQHIKNHDIIRFKTFVCTECGKGFAKAEYLQRHSLIHSGEKPHACSICGKCFNQFGNMKRHELTHTGEKPFRCKRCGKMFSQRGNLKTHIMRHQNYKPHKCNICGKRFLLNGDFDRHMMRHHNINRAQLSAYRDINQQTVMANALAINNLCNNSKGANNSSHDKACNNNNSNNEGGNNVVAGDIIKKEDADSELYYECGICKTIFNSFEDFQTHEIFCEIAGEVQVETENEVANSIDY